jgi:hypothetical protein
MCGSRTERSGVAAQFPRVAGGFPKALTVDAKKNRLTWYVRVSR